MKSWNNKYFLYILYIFSFVYTFNSIYYDSDKNIILIAYNNTICIVEITDLQK